MVRLNTITLEKRSKKKDRTTNPKEPSAAGVEPATLRFISFLEPLDFTKQSLADYHSAKSPCVDDVFAVFGVYEAEQRPGEEGTVDVQAVVQGRACGQRIRG